MLRGSGFCTSRYTAALQSSRITAPKVLPAGDGNPIAIT